MLRRADTPPGTVSSVSAMGHLSGITKISPPLHLEVMPYQVSRASSLSQPAPFPISSEFTATAGLDLKYGLARNMTFDLAVNPDFGQVEVDQAVLNLSVFETFYPEKRPFFLEGAPIFSFGNVFDGDQLRLFYSRRVGKSPQAPRAPTPGTYYADYPRTTTILGAGKLTGRTSDGFSIGVLSAITRKEEGVEEDLAGHRGAPVLFEPRASYNVVRLQKELSAEASVGMIATGAFHDQGAPSMSGGVDWNTRFGDGLYAFDGYVAGSRMTAPYGVDRIGGSAGRVGLGKLQDDHILWFTFYDFASRDFSINDLGFYNRANDHGGSAQLTYKQDEAQEPVRRYFLSLLANYRWNWDGVPTTKTIEFEPTWEFRNFWNAKVNFFHEFAAFDDETRGIIGLYRRPDANRFTATFQTDPRDALIASFATAYTTAANGMSSVLATLSCTARLSSSMELVPSLGYAATREEVAWPLFYYTAGGRNLFGTRDVDQYDLALRGTVTFTRAVSLQFFTQVFLAQGRYRDFAELGATGGLTPYAYDRAAGNPDFNEKAVNANLVFRWEYRPGSTIYLVWTQARYGDNGIYDRSVRQNLSDAFKLPMDNVLLAKISYWWSR
jgi:hypothetical protein